MKLTKNQVLANIHRYLKAGAISKKSEREFVIRDIEDVMPKLKETKKNK